MSPPSGAHKGILTSKISSLVRRKSFYDAISRRHSKASRKGDCQLTPYDE